VDLVTIEAQAEQATFVPNAGLQCLKYRVGSLDIIAGPDGVDVWREHPFRSGIPILFPWPGRIAGGRFTFGGREVRLPINEPARGNAIHGLVYNRCFSVKRRGPYYLSAELDSASDPELTAIWPYPFRLGIDYEIGGGLRMRASVINTGSSAMPFGLGAHPYFHAPLRGRAGRESVMLRVDADRRWKVDAGLIPTGECEPVAGDFDLRRPVALDGKSYDDVFLRSNPSADAPAARLVDPMMRLAVELWAAPAFREVVVYAPPDRAVVSLEPYTCAPDAFNLSARGIAAGMIELAPGARFEASFEIRLSAP
jgi:aldose 1-epimerase